MSASRVGVYFFAVALLLAPLAFAHAAGKTADECGPFIEKCGCDQVLNSQNKCVDGGKGSNKHGCPVGVCIDKTNGHETKGICTSATVCKGEVSDGTPLSKPTEADIQKSLQAGSPSTPSATGLMNPAQSTMSSWQQGLSGSILDSALNPPTASQEFPSPTANSSSNFNDFIQQQAQSGSDQTPQSSDTSLGATLQRWGASIFGDGGTQTLTPIDANGQAISYPDANGQLTNSVQLPTYNPSSGATGFGALPSSNESANSSDYAWYDPRGWFSSPASDTGNAAQATGNEDATLPENAQATFGPLKTQEGMLSCYGTTSCGSNPNLDASTKNNHGGSFDPSKDIILAVPPNSQFKTGDMVQITRNDTGDSVVAKVDDTCPTSSCSNGRIADITGAGAKELGFDIQKGIVPVTISLVPTPSEVPLPAPRPAEADAPTAQSGIASNQSAPAPSGRDFSIYEGTTPTQQPQPLATTFPSSSDIPIANNLNGDWVNPSPSTDLANNIPTPSQAPVDLNPTASESATPSGVVTRGEDLPAVTQNQAVAENTAGQSLLATRSSQFDDPAFNNGKSIGDLNLRPMGTTLNGLSADARGPETSLNSEQPSIEQSSVAVSSGIARGLGPISPPAEVPTADTSVQSGQDITNQILKESPVLPTANSSSGDVNASTQTQSWSDWASQKFDSIRNTLSDGFASIAPVGIAANYAADNSVKYTADNNSGDVNASTQTQSWSDWASQKFDSVKNTLSDGFANIAPVGIAANYAADNSLKYTADNSIFTGEAPTAQANPLPTTYVGADGSVSQNPNFSSGANAFGADIAYQPNENPSVAHVWTPDMESNIPAPTQVETNPQADILQQLAKDSGGNSLDVGGAPITPQSTQPSVIAYDQNQNSGIGKVGMDAVTPLISQNTEFAANATAQLTDAQTKALIANSDTLKEFAPGATVKNGDIVFPDKGTLNPSALQNENFQNSLKDIITNQEKTLTSALGGASGVNSFVNNLGGGQAPFNESQVPVPDTTVLSGEQITAQIEAQGIKDAAASVPVPDTTTQSGEQITAQIEAQNKSSEGVFSQAWNSVKDFFSNSNGATVDIAAGYGWSPIGEGVPGGITADNPWASTIASPITSEPSTQQTAELPPQEQTPQEEDTTSVPNTPAARGSVPNDPALIGRGSSELTTQLGGPMGGQALGGLKEDAKTDEAKLNSDQPVTTGTAESKTPATKPDTATTEPTTDAPAKPAPPPVDPNVTKLNNALNALKTSVGSFVKNPTDQTLQNIGTQVQRTLSAAQAFSGDPFISQQAAKLGGLNQAMGYSPQTVFNGAFGYPGLGTSYTSVYSGIGAVQSYLKKK